jgi:hypothetical protein
VSYAGRPPFVWRVDPVPSSSWEYTAHMKRRSKLVGLVAAVAVMLGGLFVITLGAAPGASAATARQLNYSFQWQQNGFYCGPAATRIALSARGLYFSQNYLAGQLGTTTAGTNSAFDTTRVLNRLGSTSFYETKMIPGNLANQAQINRLQWDIVFDIDRNYPLVANVVGTAFDTDGDRHGYGGGHYLAVVGYRDGGWTAKIADSADAQRVGWYWMSTTRLANWIAARGYSA